MILRKTKTALMALVSIGALSSVAFSSESAVTSSGSWGPLAAAIAIGLAAFGGALGQGKTAAAALEGMARNPQAKLLVPMIIGLALIESLVIYALVIAFQLSGKA